MPLLHRPDPANRQRRRRKSAFWVSSGTATAWHDLALYLIARHVRPATAQAAAQYLLWEWHRDGQAPFQVFDPPTGHGDAPVLAAQRAIAENFAVAAPVDAMPPRTVETFRTAPGRCGWSWNRRCVQAVRKDTRL